MKHYEYMPLPEDKQLSQELVEELKKLPPLNIHRMLTISPENRKPWLEAVTALYRSDFNPKLREIAICRYGFKTDCKYELHQHKALAAVKGVSARELKIILSEPVVKSLTEEENFICKTVDEFEDNAGISSSTLDELIYRYDVKKAMEFLILLGHYTCVCRVLNSTKIPLELVSPLANCTSPVSN